MINFFIRLFGPRFQVWLGLLIFAAIAWGFALLTGEFSNWGVGAKNGPGILLTGFAWLSFVLLIPFGYIVEHAKSAVNMKYIGWIYFLYLAGAAWLFGSNAWQIGNLLWAHGMGYGKAWELLVSAFFVLSIYASFSALPAILLAIFRKRVD